MSWLSDDITWCVSECDKTECFRHLSNLKSKQYPYSCSDFKDTNICKQSMNFSRKEETNERINW